MEFESRQWEESFSSMLLFKSNGGKVVCLCFMLWLCFDGQLSRVCSFRFSYLSVSHFEIRLFSSTNDREKWAFQPVTRCRGRRSWLRWSHWVQFCFSTLLLTDKSCIFAAPRNGKDQLRIQAYAIYETCWTNFFVDVSTINFSVISLWSRKWVEDCLIIASRLYVKVNQPFTVFNSVVWTSHWFAH